MTSGQNWPKTAISSWHSPFNTVRNTKTLRVPVRPLDVVSDANVFQFVRAVNKRREYCYLCHELGAYEKSEFLSEFDLVVSKNVGWLLWALSDSGTPGKRPGELCHILVSFQSDSPFPRLAQKNSLWWRNWIERLSFGSKHCTWPIRNALFAPRKYWGLEIAQGIYSYTAVSRNVRQSWKVLWMVLIFTVLQRNLKEWHKRPRTYVREC